ncbi:MAG: molybdopterin-guanine dinucleotide biosynthesis protein B [Dehalococcoidia bacterium]|nr:molybdopterin-guanine dinucleotide biosynthesis protein B [Dehalococcoidia bacterium]
MGAVFCIVGKSNSGKTTLLERLIPRLTGRGLSVAAIKHHIHGDFEFDQAGKDSYRLRRAGARTMVLSSPKELVTIRGATADTPLATLAAALAVEHDLVLAEGYKETKGFLKVEVHRQSLGPDLITAPEERLAVVSDGSPVVACPLFSLEDIAGLEALLVERAREAQKGDGVDIALTMNGEAVSLNPFAQSVIARGVWGMLSALRGVEKVTLATVTVRRKGQ